MTALDAEGIELLIALAGSFTTDDGSVTIRRRWRERPDLYWATCKVCRRLIKRGLGGPDLTARRILRGERDLAVFLSRHDHAIDIPTHAGDEG